MRTPPHTHTPLHPCTHLDHSLLEAVVAVAAQAVDHAARLLELGAHADELAAVARVAQAHQVAMGALDEGVHQVVALHAHRLHPARRETTRAGRRAWWPDGQAGEAVRAATTKSWRTRCSRHTDREHQRGGGAAPTCRWAHPHSATPPPPPPCKTRPCGQTACSSMSAATPASAAPTRCSR